MWWGAKGWNFVLFFCGLSINYFFLEDEGILGRLFPCSNKHNCCPSLYHCRPAWPGSWCQLCSGFHVHPESPHVFPPLRCWGKVPVEVKQTKQTDTLWVIFLLLYFTSQCYPSVSSFWHIGHHYSDGHWNSFSCDNHCLWTNISNNRLVQTFFIEISNKGIFHNSKRSRAMAQ